MLYRRWWLPAWLLLILLQVSPARAAGGASCKSISRDNLVACVTSVSFEARAAGAGVQAAEGRLLAARPWFPAAPALSVAASRRSAGGQSDLNWSATLGVELELAGQRGIRREAAVAEREAQLKSRELGARLAALAAWRAYFEVIGAGETARRAQQLEAGSRRVAEAAQAGAERGVSSGAEADLADAAYLSVSQRRIAAERELELSRVALAELLGLESTDDLAVQGTLSPLAIEGHAVATTGESPSAAALDAESRAFAARAAAERRSRIPNPTLAIFAQREGFNERVVGLGVAVPLPLPEPIGRLRAGEIAENEALSRRAHYLAENARRAARARAQRALARYEAARRAVATYTPERLQRAAATLDSLSNAVEAGRIAVRDAIILQQPLLEQLLGDIQARLELCVASAELLLAMNVRLEDGAAR